MKKRGFTLIELMMVIAILGILASVIVASAIQARERGKIARAKEEIHSIRLGAELLVADTGKYPGGCPSDAFLFAVMDAEQVVVEHPTSGFMSPPEQYVDGRGVCSWTAEDISSWAGPYLIASPTDFTDPWGNLYRLDYDYFGVSGFPGSGSGCAGSDYNGKNGAALTSSGPDEVQYTCDDVVEYLYKCPFDSNCP